MQLLNLALGMLVVAAAVALVCGAAEQEAHAVGPKLFDFANYKELFAKTYTSLSEELVRQKLYFSRAFRAFISAVKYKYRALRYYLAVNFMSDYTPAELDMMRNRVLEEEEPRVRPEAKRVEVVVDSGDDWYLSDDVTFEQPPDNMESIRKLAEEHAGEPVFKELKEVLEEEPRGARRKRSASSGGVESMRELPLDRLINTGAGARLDQETAAKVVKRVPSDNENYVPLELASFGLVDQQEQVKWYELKSKVRKSPSSSSPQFGSLPSLNPFEYLARGIGYLAGMEDKGGQGGGADEFHDANDELLEPEKRVLPDEVWVDLRDTKCFFLPRQQGKCGSCYSFAVIAMMEWLYCMRTGKLVAFSEQYMVDCGPGNVEGISGCHGGNTWVSAQFVHNFGLELRSNYPYRMAEGQCPYDKDDDIKTTGYIRSEMGNAIEVDVDMMGKAVKNGPMYLGISLGPGFREYGGGVHGHGCNQEKSSHAVVLIGHGREDGVEYWLIRNSHSVGWGEGGYYKLAKDANCIPYKAGIMYASKDGRRVSLNPVRNLRNDQKKVKKHYEEHILRAEPEPEKAS